MRLNSLTAPVYNQSSHANGSRVSDSKVTKVQRQGAYVWQLRELEHSFTASQITHAFAEDTGRHTDYTRKFEATELAQHQPSWKRSWDIIEAIIEGKKDTDFIENLSIWCGYLNLNHVNLEGADLRSFQFFQNKMKKAKLGGANLEGNALEHTSLELADCRGANLKGTSLKSSNLGGAHLEGASLENALLGGTVFESERHGKAQFGEKGSKQPTIMYGSKANRDTRFPQGIIRLDREPRSAILWNQRWENDWKTKHGS